MVMWNQQKAKLKLILDIFLTQVLATSKWEWCAVIFALAYLVLAIRENIWCWPSAFISTGIYAWLFFDVNLFMESLLNAYYLFMAIYGWYQWSRLNSGKINPAKETLKIQRWTINLHLTLIAFSISLVVLAGFLLSRYTSQDLAYLDSFTTVFALLATYMVTQKVLENWIYWMVINTVSVYLFYSKELVLTSVLFSIYIILSIVGWSKWRREYSLINSLSKKS